MLVPLLVTWLSILTAVTLFEIIDPAAEEGAPLQPSEEASDKHPGIFAHDDQLHHLTSEISLNSKAILSKLTAMKNLLESSTQHLEQIHAAAEASLSSLQQQLVKRDQGARNKPDAPSLRSGYLQSFAALSDVEELLNARLAQHTAAASDVAAWRSQLETTLRDLSSHLLKDTEQADLARFIFHLENKWAQTEELWSVYFTTVNGAEEPVYAPLFAQGSTEHASNANGIALHRAFNSPPA